MEPPVPSSRPVRQTHLCSALTDVRSFTCSQPRTLRLRLPASRRRSPSLIRGLAPVRRPTSPLQRQQRQQQRLYVCSAAQGALLQKLKAAWTLLKPHKEEKKTGRIKSWYVQVVSSRVSVRTWSLLLSKYNKRFILVLLYKKWLKLSVVWPTSCRGTAS